MARILVLGGGGGVGRVAARAVATRDEITEIVVGDVRAEAAEATVRDVGPRGRALVVDASSDSSLEAAMRGVDVVLNCVGPFYRFGPPILGAAIRAGVHYVDVCDDLQPTEAMLAMDGIAREAGIAALIGMGNSPGLANLFVALCADGLLDEVLSVDIMHIHGGEPEEGAAVLKHRIHAMTADVPLFIEGEMIHVRQLEASGQRFVRDVAFHNVGTYPVYPYPHPETLTLPRFLPGLRRATNLGSIFPLSYFHLTQDMVRVGACSETPLEVCGQPVVPLDFSVAHILARRPALLAAAGVSGPAGCLRVDVAGRAGGEDAGYVFQLSSTSVGAGEGTGIPAAAGAVLMARGGIERRGVFPPEVAAAPLDLLVLALAMGRSLGVGGADSITIERRDAEGTHHAVPLPF